MLAFGEHVHVNKKQSLMREQSKFDVNFESFSSFRIGMHCAGVCGRGVVRTIHRS